MRVWKSSSNARLVISILARLECRVGPLKSNNIELLKQYERFFTSDRILMVDISREVVERATELRVKYKLETPDALHLATAIQHSAVVLLTGDKALKQCTEVNVDVLVP